MEKETLCTWQHAWECPLHCYNRPENHQTNFCVSVIYFNLLHDILHLHLICSQSSTWCHEICVGTCGDVPWCRGGSWCRGSQFTTRLSRPCRGVRSTTMLTLSRRLDLITEVISLIGGHYCRGYKVKARSAQSTLSLYLSLQWQLKLVLSFELLLAIFNDNIRVLHIPYDRFVACENPQSLDTVHLRSFFSSTMHQRMNQS